MGATWVMTHRPPVSAASQVNALVARVEELALQHPDGAHYVAGDVL